MEQRKLGQSGLTVSALGLGCMTMSHVYGAAPDDVNSASTLERAVAIGINFFDTAQVYGMGHNEELVGHVLKAKRDKLILATKFGFRIEGGKIAGLNGRPDNAKAVADASLKRLQTDHIDLYYLHRVDPAVPIEESVGAMAELVKAGKVRYLGLSEASPKTIRRAHKVHPIAALQSEYSLWERESEKEVIPICRELGIGFVPYSPLGRGFLTGAVNPDQLAADDFRKGAPRFQGDNAKKNKAQVDQLTAIAVEREATPAQIALAWLLHQGQDIVPIPGTRRIKYLEENSAAAAIKLSQEELSAINAVFPIGSASGARYADVAMAMLDKS